MFCLGVHASAQLRHLVVKGFFLFFPPHRSFRRCCIVGSISTDFVFHVCPEAGAANEGVLANFFNSLLSKKTGAPGSPGSPGSGAVGAGVQGSAKKTGTTSVSVALAQIFLLLRPFFPPSQIFFLFLS